MPALLMLIPSLIGLAEKLFPGSTDPNAPVTGSTKEAFVMKILEAAWDNLGVKFIHDFPGIDEKRLFLRTAQVWIEELVPQITK
jgi:hypothetical protein